jgi:hypothetical protein
VGITHGVAVPFCLGVPVKIVSVMIFVGVKVFVEEVPVTETVITRRPGRVGMTGREGKSSHHLGVGVSGTAAVAGSAGGVQLLVPLSRPCFQPMYPNPASVIRSSAMTNGMDGFLCKYVIPSNYFGKGLSRKA